MPLFKGRSSLLEVQNQGLIKTENASCKSQRRRSANFNASYRLPCEVLGAALCRTDIRVGGLPIGCEARDVNCPGNINRLRRFTSGSLERLSHGAAHEWTNLSRRFDRRDLVHPLALRPALAPGTESLWHDICLPRA